MNDEDKTLVEKLEIARAYRLMAEHKRAEQTSAEQMAVAYEKEAKKWAKLAGVEWHD